MSSAPILFDPAIARQRAAARMQLDAGADFLFKRLASDLIERLGPVLRAFPIILDFGTPDESFTKAMRSIRPDSALVYAPARLSRHTHPHLVMDPEALPFKPALFDLVVSGLVLQQVNDLPGSLVQIRQTLKPDGLFLGCLAGGATLTELRQSLTQAESEITGGVSPRVFPFADVRDVGGLLQRAGFALPVTDSETITVRYDNMFPLMADLRTMGATNILTARSRQFTRRAIMQRAAEIYTQRFADPDGRIRATFEIIWLSGWAPHDSQQKPLRPGSAKQRLADALGALERSTGEKPAG